ncbi:hypothetical protein [Luteipulveratus halotolerans]|uniref:Uncharacterized protein n=1 Tax=Luteipulveratus halotolerans TaxID=1631356 RepID=A0A0L6CKF7_9MICO|nr:hypothetical protein [Luteipulveratus halotolerans]KNX38100.1 hypothetical protein VV01_14650 [Luteipulveratus halotolerans]
MSAVGDALLALLPAGTRAFVNDPPSDEELKGLAAARFPYVVFWLPPELETATRLCDVPNRFDVDFRTVVVSLSAEGVEAYASRVHSAIYRARPVLVGRRTRRIGHNGSMPPNIEMVGTRRLFQGASSWRLVSTRA